MSGNYPTAQELGDLAIIAAALDDLSEKLETGKAQVSIGQLMTYDSNGEELGYLDNPERIYHFKNYSNDNKENI